MIAWLKTRYDLQAALNGGGYSTRHRRMSCDLRHTPPLRRPSPDNTERFGERAHRKRLQKAPSPFLPRSRHLLSGPSVAGLPASDAERPLPFTALTMRHPPTVLPGATGVSSPSIFTMASPVGCARIQNDVGKVLELFPRVMPRGACL